jgi:hypothetical protein
VIDDVLAASDGLEVFGYLIAFLLALGVACNDASLAHAAARLRRRRALDALTGRVGAMDYAPAAADCLVQRVEAYLSAVAHAERTVVEYACAAIRYAVPAAHTAGRITAGQPLTIPAPVTTVPSDLLARPRLHLPAVQMPLDRLAIARRAPAAAANADLAEHHRRLITVIDRLAASGVSPSTFETPLRAGGTERPDELDGQFAQALHTYAADCVWAVMLLAPGGRVLAR